MKSKLFLILFITLSTCSPQKQPVPEVVQAVLAGNYEKLKALIDHGENINVRNEKGTTLLILAIESQKYEIANMLIEHDTKIDTPDVLGTTALMYALSAKGNTIYLIKHLLDKGANPNARTKKGFTPLFYALHNDSLLALNLLLEKGADPTIKADDDLTVLHESAANGNAKAVRMLLPYFKDLSIKDSKGYTPLMYAKENDKREVASLLDSVLSNVNNK